MMRILEETRGDGESRMYFFTPVSGGQLDELIGLDWTPHFLG
jgi:hypothetical protein